MPRGVPDLEFPDLFSRLASSQTFNSLPSRNCCLMEDTSIPSISSGAVGSRFESQADIDLARQRRDEQWKAAYARYFTNCNSSCTAN
jgi:hypothetical protein